MSRLIGVEGLQRAEIGRRGDEGGVAGREIELAEIVERLLRPETMKTLSAVQAMPSPAICPTSRSRSGRWPSLTEYCRAARPASPARMCR